MSLLSQDYLQLKQFKIFLQKHKSVKADSIEKEKVGQMMLNNKFFHDFDEDGEITFADYNIAWNWLMQGKPKNMEELDEYKKTAKKLPYERIQQNNIHVLLDSNVPETKKTPLKASEVKRKIFTFNKRKNKKESNDPVCVVLDNDKPKKLTQRKPIVAYSQSESKKIDTSLELQQKDYRELNKVKQYLEKHKQIKISDLHKLNVGQSLLNNKYFDDFDNDGVITFSDYNIAWNWLMQGKPTSLSEFANNAPDNMKTSDIPYQAIQKTQENILIEHSNRSKKALALSMQTETKSKPKQSKPIFRKKQNTKTDSLKIETFGDKWESNYFSKDSRMLTSFSVPTNEPEKTNLKILTTDYRQLEEMRLFLKEHNQVSVDDLEKQEVSQSIINNKFFHDFDMDGEITFSDYIIAWNWVMQGKPTDIVKFAKNKSATPDTHRIPYQSIQEGNYNILNDNRLIIYDRGEETLGNEKLISGLGLAFDTGVEIIGTGIDEESSDYNEDGEIDDIDLQILECFIMLGGDGELDLCEYNRDRGTCPEASKLPNMLTAKFACDTSYYYGDVHLPGDDLIQNEDIEYYMAWLHGDEEFPDRDGLRFILSNNWIETPYAGPGFREVLRDCNIRDKKTEKSLHSTSIYRVDYRDYLIMKEWLRLGKPNFKGKQSEYDALAWFNANSAEGTPLACKLPFEAYMDIGSSCYTFEDTYSGVENL